MMVAIATNYDARRLKRLTYIRINILPSLVFVLQCETGPTTGLFELPNWIEQGWLPKLKKVGIGSLEILLPEPA